MSELKRCAICKGNKKINGLGMLEVTCHNCVGVGFIDASKIEKVVEVQKPIKIPVEIAVKEEKDAVGVTNLHSLMQQKRKKQA